MKGIILAGGSGTRLYPATLGLSKQLLPVYDKPMIYYPLTTLMLSGIRDILIISTPRDTPLLGQFLGKGTQWGLSLSYAVQDSPRGIADAFRVGAEFIGNDDVALILGDNIFISNDLQIMLHAAASKRIGARLFACRVRDPERFGVVEIDSDSRVISLEEKPKCPKSRWAVTGLYFYDNSVVDAARELTPSPRGELEITALNASYLSRNALHVERIGRGVIWIDTGTHESLLEAGVLVQTLQKRHNQMIGSPEEVAFRLGYIGKEHFAAIAGKYSNSEYGYHLLQILDE
jgi:glucose-1-phosphate thymidylyltransferase